jgi:hypothetical protein
VLTRALAAVAAAALLLVAVACSGFPDGSSDALTVGGDRVSRAYLLTASAGLCEARKVAPADPTAARAAFYNSSHNALHTVARGLEAVDRAAAADLLVGMQKVESELESKPPELAADLGRLGDLYRSGLGRLAITAPPCVE